MTVAMMERKDSQGPVIGMYTCVWQVASGTGSRSLKNLSNDPDSRGGHHLTDISIPNGIYPNEIRSPHDGEPVLSNV